MNSNLFERKNFLEKNWISTNSTDSFATTILDDNIILNVNLLRATANEAESFKNYLNNIVFKMSNSLIIDLSECNFVDSTFLSKIITFNKKTNTNVKLIVADTRQLSLFKITKIDSLFNIYPSLEQAI